MICHPYTSIIALICPAIFTCVFGWWLLLLKVLNFGRSLVAYISAKGRLDMAISVSQLLLSIVVLEIKMAAG